MTMVDSEQPAKRRKLSSDGEPVLATEETSATSAQAEPVSHFVNGNNTSKAMHTDVRADNDVARQTTTTPDTQDIDRATATTPQAIESPTQSHPSPAPLSKNRQKKMRKQQEWEAGRDSRRVKRREKQHEKRVRKREQRENEEQERAALGLDTHAQEEEEQARRRYQRPIRLPVTILIDCGFDDLMTDRDRVSLASQITRSYSDNYHAHLQANLVLCSWNGQLKHRFDTVLSKQYENWRNVRFTPQTFAEAAQDAEKFMKSSKGGRLAGIFEKYAMSTRIQQDNTAAEPPTHDNPEPSTQPNPPTTQEATNDTTNPTNPTPYQRQQDAHRTSIDSLKSASETIYLTSDSPHTLTTLNPYSTYIIGGLVDKNRLKGICYKRACDAGIKTAKLPIGEFMEMRSRFVLATNHVNEIMLRYLSCGDWGEAFLAAIPKRKGGKLRGKHSRKDGGGGDDGGSDEEEDEDELDEPGGGGDDDRHEDDGERDGNGVDGDLLMDEAANDEQERADVSGSNGAHGQDHERKGGDEDGPDPTAVVASTT